MVNLEVLDAAGAFGPRQKFKTAWRECALQFAVPVLPGAQCPTARAPHLDRLAGKVDKEEQQEVLPPPEET